jgi:uncharacterized protein
MKTKQLSRQGAPTHAIVLDRDDEVMTCLTEFARSHRIQAGHFTAIGAFSSATIAFFDWETKQYNDIPVNEQVEVLVLAGDLSWHASEQRPIVHAHVVLGRRDGSTIGGHLRRAIVRPTLELMLAHDGTMRRIYDQESGLALIDLEA